MVQCLRQGLEVPQSWEEALISEPTARELISSEFPRFNVRLGGIPDLVFIGDRGVITAECKRLAGRYRNNDCEWRRWGDTFRASQHAWAEDARRGGMSPETLIEVWWERVDVASCEDSTPTSLRGRPRVE
jgi:hypothetical protein